MTLLDAALEHADAGRRIFPVTLDKRPRVAGGFKSATTNRQQIERWWTSWPDAGIATPTGRGWFVLDVDDDEALKALEAKHGPLPPTVEVVTPRPGRHIYLRGNSTNRSGSLPAGIDVRGTGGYVLLPPSPHTNGHYEWREAADEIAIAHAPGWLLKLLQPPKRRTGSSPPVATDIPRGRRNTTLASLAGTMRRRGMSERAIESALLVTNRDQCKPPLADNDVRKIAHSIARYSPEDTRVSLEREWLKAGVQKGVHTGKNTQGGQVARPA
jgi:hypothetical protein